MNTISQITAFPRVPDHARGLVCELRPRWSFKEVGQQCEVDLVHEPKSAEHRRLQPFGQTPTHGDDECEIFESGAVVLRIADPSMVSAFGGLRKTDVLHDFAGLTAHAARAEARPAFVKATREYLAGFKNNGGTPQ